MLIKNKKTILKLLIIFTLCPVIFLSKPNKVTATYPVFDAAHTAISTENASVNTDLWIKEHIFDPILWAVANMAVEKIADSTVDWINSGFEGGPSFVTDLDGFLTSVGDNALGEFLEGSELAFLCSPFSLDIKIALTQQFGGERESHCTLTDAFGNAEGALENALNNLGNDWSWEKFNSISQPQNNTYGAYLKGYMDFALKAAGKKDKEIIKSNWGGGFLSFDSCEDDTTEDICNENGCKTITVPGRCTTKTPGTTINESLTKVLGLGNDKLVIADEMDEIIGALLNQLVKSVFSSTTGLFDSNPSDNGFSQLPSSVIEKLIDVIEVKIKTEEDYREWKQKSLDAVNLAENYIDALISCWQSCPIEPPDEESQIASIESKVSALEATKLIKTDPFQESLRIDINSATININNKLQLIIDRINTATGENGEADPNEILTISNDFNNLIGLHTSSDVFEAQYEFENSIQFKMNTIISNMLTEKTSCEESGGTFLMCTSLSVFIGSISDIWSVTTGVGWTCGVSTVDDADSNTYDTVLIGTQCWMAENLNVGTRIDGVDEMADTGTIEKYCYGDDEANCTTDGGFYQWDEAMQYIETEGAQGICPADWHIPTDSEQDTLDQYLSTGTCDTSRSGVWDCAPAGTALKELGSSGFEGVLSGYRYTNGAFRNSGAYTGFWSSSVSGARAWKRTLRSSFSTVSRYPNGQAYGFSVRCLKN